MREPLCPLLSTIGQGLSDLTELIQQRQNQFVIDLLSLGQLRCVRTPPPPIYRSSRSSRFRSELAQFVSYSGFTATLQSLRHLLVRGTGLIHFQKRVFNVDPLLKLFDDRIIRLGSVDQNFEAHDLKFVQAGFRGFFRSPARTFNTCSCVTMSLGRTAEVVVVRGCCGSFCTTTSKPSLLHPQGQLRKDQAPRRSHWKINRCYHKRTHPANEIERAISCMHLRVCP